jgi:primosomal protein N' (replication factor Y)
VVALLPDNAGSIDPSVELKSVVELVDPEPLVTEELIELTQWVADYYRAPWGEVIKSSLPAGINADAESVLTITDVGRRALETATPRSRASARMKALHLVGSSSSLNARELASVSAKTRVSTLVRELERDAYVTSTREMALPGRAAKASAGRQTGSFSACRQWKAIERSPGTSPRCPHSRE